jgi:23S rRNA (adenine2503-C2)-methyltransferase
MSDIKNISNLTVEVKPLFGASLPELTGLMDSFGQPAYRARQLYDALYSQRIPSLEQITTLPAALRQTLEATGHTVGLPELVQTARSIDGTERYLVRMADGETVETVWMPGGDGGERGDGTQAAEEEEHPSHDDDDYKRATICISSQVGCAVNCQFCLTAKLGIRRNLTPGEIAGQVAAVLNRHNVEVGRDRINLVFMGMGEPFLNYTGFMDAVRLLTGPMRIPESRMTVSTSGILPGIEQFAQETVRPKLAVSLNASNDVVRESIMPITRKWNIAALLAAISTVPLRPRERVTFEYVMLGGINDQREHADELIALLKNLRAKINLIVWNSGPDMPFHEPTPQDVGIFQKRLRDAGVPAFIRKPRGRDIYAACGQLKRTVESSASSTALVTLGSAATL